MINYINRTMAEGYQLIQVKDRSIVFLGNGCIELSSSDYGHRGPMLLFDYSHPTKMAARTRMDRLIRTGIVFQVSWRLKKRLCPQELCRTILSNR